MHGWFSSLAALLALVLAACAQPTPAPSATGGAGAAAPSRAAPPAPTSAPAAAPSAAAVAKPALQPLSPPVQVSVGTLGLLTDAGIFIALDRGYFAEQGLDVKIEQFDGGTAMVPALAARQIQVGGGGVSAGLINAVQRGIPLKIVADRGQQRAGFGASALVIRKDLIDGGTVRDARDLKGLTIAVAAAGLSAPEGLFLSGALAPVGLTVKDLNVTEMPFPDMVAALANRSIDGAILVEPFVTRVVEMEAAVRWKGADELTGVIMYSADFIASQPEAAKRWMVAYVKGIREYMDAVSGPRNLEPIIPILTNHTTIKDPALYQKIYLAGYDVNGELNVESLNSAQDVWTENGFLESKLDART